MTKLREALKTIMTLLKAGPYGKQPVTYDEHSYKAVGSDN